MAAHVLTGLKQTLEEVEKVFNIGEKFGWRQLQDALNISCWTEDLHPDHWRDLQQCVIESDAGFLRIWVQVMIPRYEILWHMLSCPVTREEWRERYHKKYEGNPTRWVELTDKVLVSTIRS